MKLAIFQGASRASQPVVVWRDLSAAHYGASIANTLQQAPDAAPAPDWRALKKLIDASS